jgi:ATP-binding cassette, subfamily B (MDR/TAP), member 1
LPKTVGAGITNDRLDQLIYQVNQRIEDKKGNKKAKQETVPYSKILLTYADRTDKVLMTLGYLTSIITGLGLPSFVFLFGDIVDDFGSKFDIVEAIRPMAIELVIIGAFIWLTSYLYFVFLVIVSERIGKKTRVAYLKAILSQDITWFDEINVTELSARLSKEC